MSALRVTSGEWLVRAGQLKEAGSDWFGSLVGVDDPAVGEIELILRVGPAGELPGESLTCVIGRNDARIDSLAHLWSGAAFAEREVAEMLGVEFVGHPDPRPLLLPLDVAYPPLRRDAGLRRRVEEPWPGVHEPGESDRKRRRSNRAIASDPDEWAVTV